MATEQHDRRKAQIIATAQQLFFQEGYEKTSVAQIIDTVGIAKGTFYHYFPSKEALLEELVTTMMAPVMASLEDILDDQSTTAMEKIRLYFQGAAAWKANNREIMMALLQVMYRDDNILLRHRLNQYSLEITSGPVTRMIEQGVAGGEFKVEDPQMCAAYILRGFVSSGDAMAGLLLRMSDDPSLMKELDRHIEYLEHAISRLLGLPATTTLNIFDRKALRQLLQMEEQQ